MGMVGTRAGQGACCMLFVVSRLLFADFRLLFASRHLGHWLVTDDHPILSKAGTGMACVKIRGMQTEDVHHLPFDHFSLVLEHRRKLVEYQAQLGDVPLHLLDGR